VNRPAKTPLDCPPCGVPPRKPYSAGQARLLETPGVSCRGWIARWGPLLVLILLGAALRLWRLGALELIGDESYYWLWSRYLDWAYFDHPAGVAVTVWLSTLLGGQGTTGIRWLTAMLGVASIALTYRLGVQMLSRRAGLFAAFLVAAGAPYLLTSRFVYTDALQLALLLLNMACFWRMVEEKPAPGWPAALAFGTSLALLLNTKYNAYLYAATLLVAVLIEHRWLLARWRVWVAALVAVLGLAPAIAWNAAHGWVSFRWQLSHASFSLAESFSVVGNARHALGYLTWPLVVVALIGLIALRSTASLAVTARPDCLQATATAKEGGRKVRRAGRPGNPVRRSAERLLTLVALVLLLPVALSPANSPRNLSTGLVLLLLLAGARWPSAQQRRWSAWFASGLAALALLAAVYGLGTVVETIGPSRWPASSAVAAIRRDACGMRELGAELASSSEPIFALDYSSAGQIAYFSGKPAYTSWGQFRIWGVPVSPDWTVVSLDYLPWEFVDARLRTAFQEVEGPRALRCEEWGESKEVRIWRARGLGLDSETFLEQFDFLALLRASR